MSYPFVPSAVDLGPARCRPALAFLGHMAEGGGTVAFLSRPNARSVSVHFVVEYSGRVVQMLELSHMHSSLLPTSIRTTNDMPYTYQGETIRYGRSAALAALGKWADTTASLGPNHATIAAEVEGFAADGPNDKQRASLAALVRDLDLPANLGHRDFASYKPCPGHSFPWAELGGHGARAQEVDMPGLTFRILDRVDGIATIVGTGHALIRTDNGVHVQVPAGQRREVAARITLTQPHSTPGGTVFPIGTTGYLVGNVPGATPDKSMGAMVLERDVSFVPDPPAPSDPTVLEDLDRATASIDAARHKLGG